ncbi:MAG: hypothetical protein E6I97_16540, partial [Chloroflexi bacterium]
MGIGGQGISAVAQMVLQASGESVTVTGCDMQASSTTRALQRIGVPVEIGHSANHLEGIDRLVVVPAALVLNPDHPELATARMRGIPLITWQEMLGELMQKKCVISVGGVHGKGTTTAMLALMEFEHPEFFANYEAFLASFEHFVRGMDMDGDWPLPPTLVLNANSAGCVELLDRIKDWPGRVVTYAVEGFMTQKDINAASKEKKLTDFEGETVISMNSGVAQ